MFTDLHYGEQDDYDHLNNIAQNNLLDYEKPDFVILSGDMISGYNKNFLNESRYKYSWDLITQPMRDRGIPWSITFGNHDAEGPYSGKMLVDLDRTYPGSMTQYGTVYGVGETNYVLPIQSSKSEENASLIYVFDSDNFGCGSLGEWGCVFRQQVKWYEETSDANNKLPSVAFIHIPPLEVVDLWNNFNVYGDFGDEAVCCYKTTGTNFLDSMIQRKDIKALYFGHDHRNDYHGDYYGLDLGYGRKTGYGSYDPKYTQGARVIELHENPFSFQTWIRNVNGGLDVQPLHKPGDQVPMYCCGDNGGNSFEGSWIVYLVLLGVFLSILVVVQLKTVREDKHIKMNSL